VELYFAEVQVGLPPSLPAVVFRGRRPDQVSHPAPLIKLHYSYCRWISCASLLQRSRAPVFLELGVCPRSCGVRGQQ